MPHSERFMNLVNASKARISECTIYDVEAKQKASEKFFLVDTREEGEWEAFRIPGAIYLGKGVLERDVEEKIPDLDAQVILYCGGGFRSALSADAMQQMGYTNVFSMDGGIRDWMQAGFALDS